MDAARLQQRARDEHLANVLFLPRRPMSEISSVLAAAEVLLVHLRDDPLFAITLPSKTQAYLAAGRPILMAVRGDAARLVEAVDAGIACEPENAESIAAIVQRFLSMTPAAREAMGRRGSIYYNSELSMKTGSRRFERVFFDVTTSPERN